MSQDQSLSIQSILFKRQRDAFVGRLDHLSFFRNNLQTAFDDDQRRFVIHVSGQGGIGKTSLFAKVSRNLGQLSFDTQLSVQHS